MYVVYILYIFSHSSDVYFDNNDDVVVIKNNIKLDIKIFDENLSNKYKNDVDTNNVKYYVIKKVDMINDSKLLKYLHETYMTEHINAIFYT